MRDHIKTVEKARERVDSWPNWKRDVTYFRDLDEDPMSEEKQPACAECGFKRPDRAVHLWSAWLEHGYCSEECYKLAWVRDQYNQHAWTKKGETPCTP